MYPKTCKISRTNKETMKKQTKQLGQNIMWQRTTKDAIEFVLC